jgi:hypothetical protein
MLLGKHQVQLATTFKQRKQLNDGVQVWSYVLHTHKAKAHSLNQQSV